MTHRALRLRGTECKIWRLWRIWLPIIDLQLWSFDSLWNRRVCTLTSDFFLRSSPWVMQLFERLRKLTSWSKNHLDSLSTTERDGEIFWQNWKYFSPRLLQTSPTHLHHRSALDVEPGSELCSVHNLSCPRGWEFSNCILARLVQGPQHLGAKPHPHLTMDKKWVSGEILD